MNEPIKDPVKWANRIANEAFTAMPRLEGFERCSEPGCLSDGFPGSGKCWEHTPSDGKYVLHQRMTKAEFAAKYPPVPQNKSPLAKALEEHVCGPECRRQ